MPWTIGAGNSPRLSSYARLRYGLDGCPDSGMAGHMAGVARAYGMPWTRGGCLDAVQLTPGPSLGLIDAGRVYALDIATGPRVDKVKPPD